MIHLISKLTCLHTLRYLENEYQEHEVDKNLTRYHAKYPDHYSGSRLTTVCINLVEENTLKYIVDNCLYLHTLHMRYPHERYNVWPNTSEK